MSEQNQSGGSAQALERGVGLPTRVIVSLRAGFVLAIANILCVAIIAWAFLRVQGHDQVITVTGSAKKTILSDLAVWRANVSTNAKGPVEAYDALKIASDRTREFLLKNGIAGDQISISSISTQKNFTRDDKGNVTDQVSSYDLFQAVQVTSTDVRGVGNIAAKASELLKQGVMLESESPQYFYTRLADLKVEMLAEATKDAAVRAKQIAENSGSSLGNVREAKMGVMQINPANSNEVSDSGNNDTSSLQKEITAVVSAKFAVE
jgi:hypothetical protein